MQVDRHIWEALVEIEAGQAEYVLLVAERQDRRAPWTFYWRCTTDSQLHPVPADPRLIAMVEVRQTLADWLARQSEPAASRRGSPRSPMRRCWKGTSDHGGEGLGGRYSRVGRAAHPQPLFATSCRLRSRDRLSPYHSRVDLQHQEAGSDFAVDLLEKYEDADDRPP